MTNTQLLVSLRQLLEEYTLDVHSRVVEKLILQIITIIETQQLLEEQREKLEELERLLRAN